MLSTPPAPPAPCHALQHVVLPRFRCVQRASRCHVRADASQPPEDDAWQLLRQATQLDTRGKLMGSPMVSTADARRRLRTAVEVCTQPDAVHAAHTAVIRLQRLPPTRLSGGTPAPPTSSSACSQATCALHCERCETTAMAWVSPNPHKSSRGCAHAWPCRCHSLLSVTEPRHPAGNHDRQRLPQVQRGQWTLFCGYLPGTVRPCCVALYACTLLQGSWGAAAAGSGAGWTPPPRPV